MDDLTDVVLWEHDGEQLRFTVSEFRDKLYLSIRYWYLSFDEEWCPTTKGVTFPYNHEIITYFAGAISQLMSQTESELYFGPKEI